MDRDVEHVRMLDTGRISLDFDSQFVEKVLEFNNCVNVQLFQHGNRSGLSYICSRNGFMVCEYRITENLCQKYLKARDEALDHGLNVTHVALPTLTEKEDDRTKSAYCFEIALPSSPYYISLSHNEQILAVACNQNVYFYETAILQTKKSEATFFLAHFGNTLLEMAWRPWNCQNDEQMELLAVTSGNETFLYRLDGGKDVIDSISATSACWSPCGKQIALGSNDGNVWIYDRSSISTNSEHIAPPESLDTEIGNFIVHHINWAEKELMFLGYKALNTTQEEEVVQAFLYEHRRIIALDEVVAFTEAMDCRKHQYYSCFLEEWRMFFVGCSLSADIELLVADPDSNDWEVWKPQEKYQARLPMDVNDDESLPVGLQLVLNSSKSVNLDRGLYPPCPILSSVTTSGLLVSFALVDLSFGEEIGFLIKPDKKLLKQQGIRTGKIDVSKRQAQSQPSDIDEAAEKDCTHALQVFKEIDVNDTEEIPFARTGEFVNLLNASCKTTRLSAEAIQQQFRESGCIKKKEFLAWYSSHAINQMSLQEEQIKPSDTTDVPISKNPLSQFMPREGSWRCASCSVQNDNSEALRCVACTIPNPNQSQVTRADSSCSGFKFETKDSAAPYKFGLSSTSIKSIATLADQNIGFDFSGLTATPSTNVAAKQLKDSAKVNNPSTQSESYGQDGDNEFAEEDESADEEAERAEAGKAARDAFQATVSELGAIHSEDFSQLFKALGSTYCEEVHLPLLKPLLVDGILPEDIFVNWYTNWLFAEDSEDEDSEDDDCQKSPGFCTITDVSTPIAGTSPVASLRPCGKVTSPHEKYLSSVCFSINEELASCDTAVPIVTHAPSTSTEEEAPKPKLSAAMYPPDTSAKAQVPRLPADNLSKNFILAPSCASINVDSSQVKVSPTMYPPDTSSKAQPSLLSTSNLGTASNCALKVSIKGEFVSSKSSTSTNHLDTSPASQANMPTSHLPTTSSSAYPPDTSTKAKPPLLLASKSASFKTTTIPALAASAYPPDTSTKAKPPLLQASKSASSRTTTIPALAVSAYPPDTSVKPKPLQPKALTLMYPPNASAKTQVPYKVKNDAYAAQHSNSAISQDSSQDPSPFIVISKSTAQDMKLSNVKWAHSGAPSETESDIMQYMAQLVNNFETSVQRSTKNAEHVARQNSAAQAKPLIEVRQLKQNIITLCRDVSTLDENRQKIENDTLYVIGSDSEVHEQIAFGYELFQGLQNVQWKQLMNEQPLDMESSEMRRKLKARIAEINRCCHDLEQHLTLLEEATNNDQIISSFRAENLFRVLKQTYEKSKTEYNKVCDLSLAIEALHVQDQHIPEITLPIGNVFSDKAESTKEMVRRLAEAERSTAAMHERFAKLCNGGINCRMLGPTVVMRKKSISSAIIRKDPDQIVSKLMSSARITIPSPVPTPRQIEFGKINPENAKKSVSVAGTQQAHNTHTKSIHSDDQSSPLESTMHRNIRKGDSCTSSDVSAKSKNNSNDSIRLAPIVGGVNRITVAPSIGFGQRLEAFYTKIDGEKVANVARQLSEYRGRESELLESLFVTYGLATRQNVKTLVKEFIESGVIPNKVPTSSGDVSAWQVNAMSKTTTTTGANNPVHVVAKEIPSSIAKPNAQTEAFTTRIDPQVRARLVKFYEKHNPSKLADVDKTLNKYKGREDELFRSLSNKYKVQVESVPNTVAPLRHSTNSSPFGNTSTFFPIQASPSTNSSTAGAPGTAFLTSFGNSSNTRPNTSSMANFGTSEPGSTFSKPSQPMAISKPFGGTTSSHRERLVQFYQKYNPGKLKDVDTTLAKYSGRETELFGLLEKKYGKQSLTQLTPQSGSVFGSESTSRNTAVPVFGASSTLGNSAASFGGTTAVFGGTNTLQQRSGSEFGGFASSTTKPSTTTGSGFGSFRSVGTGFGSIASSQGAGTGFGNGFGASAASPFGQSSSSAFNGSTSFTQMRS